MRDPVQAFEDHYGFVFDDFQRIGCGALADHHSVLVAAPTGAGKTVVGEFAAWLALTQGGRTFYTTPIKALSNQKYNDFVALHGAPSVGLLTGDNSVNGDAPIVVMTTEVLRNMLYSTSPGIDRLRYVVLDEVHYLQDPYRGAVWEEVLIHLPEDVKVACLSATVSNAEEFGDWIRTLRGDTEVVIEDKRPVEIRHWYMASDELLPMFVATPGGGPRPNPRARELERRRVRGGPRPQRGRRRESSGRARIPLRFEVIDRLDAEEMLPAIYFIFSRKGCDEAVKQCLRANLSLITPEERARVLSYAEAKVADLTPLELDVLGYDRWIAGLSRGIASHHAGMIPPFKEAVEELFSQGLIRAVFATETLALGINMPARTVVIESLMKFTGDAHELMTPGEFTQLSGRAGRRGIDDLGHCLVLMQRYTRFDAITRLATTRTYPLRSSFEPSYNMAVNLVRNHDKPEAERLIASSFAQFQADREIVRLRATRDRQKAFLDSYRQRALCDRGDIAEYAELLGEVRRLTKRGRTKESVEEAMLSLRPGDVIEVPTGKRAGTYAVLEVNTRAKRGPRAFVLSEDRALARMSANDFPVPPERVGTVRFPAGFDPRDARSRRHVARRLTGVARTRTTAGSRPGAAADRAGDDEMAQARARLEAHPCHDCPDLDRHLHYLERAVRVDRELTSLDRRIEGRSGTLVRRFENVLDVLESLDYLTGWRLTPKGEMLAGVYNESDLLVVEALSGGRLASLGAADIAAVCSALVYETRGPETEEVAGMPTASSADAYSAIVRLWKDIRAEEDDHGLVLTREPDPGFAARAYDWAAGADLDAVVDEGDAAGDFVRSIKQLIDLLRQIEEVSPDAALAAKTREAIGGLDRSVVAYSALDV